MFSYMTAANASARGQRAAILSSPLRELTGFCLVVDCLTAGCRSERAYSITALAACYDGTQMVSSVIRLMRCAGCGKPVGAAWLVTGPTRSTSASGLAVWRCWGRLRGGERPGRGRMPEPFSHATLPEFGCVLHPWSFVQ